MRCECDGEGVKVMVRCEWVKMIVKWMAPPPATPSLAALLSPAEPRHHQSRYHFLFTPRSLTRPKQMPLKGAFFSCSEAPDNSTGSGTDLKAQVLCLCGGNW